MAAPVQIGYNPELGEQTFELTLDEEPYLLRLRFQEESQGFYADLFTADGEILQAGRRLSPGWSPFLRINGPKGGFLVGGTDLKPELVYYPAF
jgi:hypothetical protein